MHKGFNCLMEQLSEDNQDKAFLIYCNFVDEASDLKLFVDLFKKIAEKMDEKIIDNILKEKGFEDILQSITHTNDTIMNFLESFEDKE